MLVGKFVIYFKSLVHLRVEVKVLKYRIVIFKLCLCAAGRLLPRRRRRKKRRVKRAVRR